MDDNTKKEAQELIDNLNNPDIQNKVQEVKDKDPLEQLRLSLFDFFENRLRAIEKEDEFEKRIKDELLQKMDDGEVSTAQLMQLYNQVKGQSSKALEVLLDVFKPGQSGNVSPIVDQPKTAEGDESSIHHEFDKNLSPDQQDSLNKVINFLEIMKKQRDVTEGGNSGE